MNDVILNKARRLNDQSLKLDILEAILEKHIDDFKNFTKVILQLKK